MKDRSGLALGALTRLRISGFSIALDSMGADIEELDELLHIPFNEHRLKKILVNQIGKNMEVEFNVSTLISQAEKRDIQTCAVGVKRPKLLLFFKTPGVRLLPVVNLEILCPLHIQQNSSAAKFHNKLAINTDEKLLLSSSDLLQW